MRIFRNWFSKGTQLGTPLPAWEDQLARVRHLMDQLQFRTAAELLRDLMKDKGRAKDPFRASFQPVLLGELGECLFQQGEVREAFACTRKALALVEKNNDEDGIIASLGNLYELYRYLEQSAEAAKCADQLAECHTRQGRETEASRYRRQAALVRAGEPRNRVVVAIDGQRHELDEVLAGVPGRVEFHFERNKQTLRLSADRTEKGSRAYSQGQLDEALDLFREAARLDPMNPQPHLEVGGTLLRLGRAAEAVAAFERTEELAPGWFTCRSDAWLARQIVAGRYDLQAYLSLRTLEEGHHELLADALKRYPDLAPVHHLHGLELRRSSQTLLAEQAFRRGLACAEEPDIRTRLLADLAGTIESSQRRRPVLEDAIACGGNIVSLAAARIMLTFI